MSKERLDKLVTARRLIRSRSKAQRMIMAGRVKVDGQVVYRPGHMVDPEAEIELVAPAPYVSRGGEKLAGALVDFRIEPKGMVCLDVGSSTGGFTDCLLKHGASRVHAGDVGKGQLDWRLRNDPRVVVHEGINARYLTLDDIGERVELATIDVSFISLQLVIPPLAEIVDPEGEIIALVKPQFEAGRENVTRGGVVRDPAVHIGVLKGLLDFITTETPWGVVGVTHSPLRGPAGNIEYFLHLRREEGRAVDLAKVVARAHSAFPND